MIDKRIEFYKKENARLFALIDTGNPQNVRDLIIKTINEHEAVIRELKYIKKLSIPIVSKQSELLIAFKNWEVDNDIKNLFPEDVVGLYIESNL